MGEDRAAAQAAADPDGQALAALRFGWGEAYLIGHDDEHGWWASRRDQVGGLLTADGPDALWQAVRDDYDLKPVPRSLPVQQEEAVP